MEQPRPSRRTELIEAAVLALAEVPEFIWDGRRLPVPIEEIADSHFGFRVIEVAGIAARLGEEGLAEPGGHVSGVLLPVRHEIWVDADESASRPRRRRYTVAHELAHHVLHSPAGATVLCRTDEVAPVRCALDTWGTQDPSFDQAEDGIEWEANVFAGALLIPPALLREFVGRRNYYERERAIAKAFDVSPSAVNGRGLTHYLHDAPQ